MSDATAGCSHQISGRVTAQADAGCTADDSDVLHIARLFFRTFAAPQSHSWIEAIDYAERSFEGRQPALLAVTVLRAVQAMGQARRSGFNFATPDCDVCAPKLTEHERQFISVLMDLRKGRSSCAHVNAMLLCEGNDSTAFLEAMTELRMLLVV